MLKISASQLKDVLDYPSLIEALEGGFCEHISVPSRHHHEYNVENDSRSSTLLLMPAWQDHQYLGVKIVTITPENHKLTLPTIQGLYLLFDANNGALLAQIDLSSLTNLRTAATSALASKFLSRSTSKKLLMLGTGSLAPYLIQAHCAVRSIEQIYLWGRSEDKASQMNALLAGSQDVTVVKDLASVIPQADIISSATLSSEPLIFGKLLQPGQHLDLVGAYKPDMREADDTVIKRAQLFYDTDQGIYESGDLAIPIQEGLISEEDLIASLTQLCRREYPGRTTEEQITLFKSVGHASEDLIAAQLAYQRLAKDI